MEEDLIIFKEKEVKIIKWKVKSGTHIYQGSVLALYKINGNDKVLKFKADRVGTVKKLYIQENGVAEPGKAAMRIQGCTHPTVMKKMCAECGADLSQELERSNKSKAESVTASVAMVHSVPELIVSEQEAKELGRADESRLLKSRKLVLLVDLDQTLIHTTNDNIPSNLKDVYHFQLPHGHRQMWFHTKFRPHTEEFLARMSKLYELHICTFGVRLYAHTIARFLDPEGIYFSHRILSRDEFFNPTSKTANLKALFPCGDSMACIIDDREDVWNFAPNLVHVKPYLFFDGTADINAPPGLDKGGKESQDPSASRRVVKVHKVKKKTTSNQEKENTTKDANLNQQEEDTDGGDKDVDKAVDSESQMEVTESEAVKDGSLKVTVGGEIPKAVESETPAVDNIKEDAKSDLSPGQELPNGGGDATVLSDEAMEVDHTTEQGKSPEIVGQAGDTSVQSEKLAESADTVVQSEKLASAQSEKLAESGDTVVQSEKLAESADTADQSKKLAESGDTSAQSEKLAESDGTCVQSEKPTESGDTSVQSQKPAESSDTSVQSEKLAESDDTCVQSQRPAESGDISVQSQKPAESGDIYVQTETPTDTGVQSEKPAGGKSTAAGDSAQNNAKESSGTAAENSDYEEIVEWADEDDYLHYLEDVLKNIHSAFYEVYDQLQTKTSGDKEMPDLKNIIPYVKKKVLKGANILFSGVFPTNQPAEKSHAYIAAKSLGATIQSSFVPPGEKDATTHLLAAKLGTAKVNSVRKHKGVHVLTPDWLWCCANRWERVDERLFPLTETTQSAQGCGSPDVHQMSRKRKRDDRPRSRPSELKGGGGNAAEPSPSGSGRKVEQRRFSESVSPMYALSKDDWASMDKEVQDLLDSSSDSDSESSEDDREQILRKQVLSGRTAPESSSDDSLSGDFPHGWRNKRKRKRSEDNDNEEEEEDEQRPLMSLIENPEGLVATSDDSDQDDDDFEDSIGSVDEEMAAALEKEFLS